MRRWAELDKGLLWVVNGLREMADGVVNDANS